MNHHYHLSLKNITLIYLKILDKNNKLVRDHLPSRMLKILFRTTQRLTFYFRFKDAIPHFLPSSVIYEYKCPRYNSKYISTEKTVK